MIAARTDDDRRMAITNGPTCDVEVGLDMMAAVVLNVFAKYSLVQKRTPTPAPPAVRTFSVRQATWLMLRDPTDLDAEEQAYLGELLRVCPPAATACHLARAFFALVRDREAAALDEWLSEAAWSDLPEMSGFALGIRRDRAAVDAGLRLEWSNGQTEGFVNKLKTLKRQMFGRAGLALLRERMLDGGSVAGHNI